VSSIVGLTTPLFNISANILPFVYELENSTEVHNSRWPFDCLTVYDYRRECKGTATVEQHGCSNILVAIEAIL